MRRVYKENKYRLMTRHPWVPLLSVFSILSASFFMLSTLPVLLGGCAMKEEVKRIEEVQRAQKQREVSQSTNLTGEQIFVRSCNTCHPSGRAGMGPSLAKLAEDYPDDKSLKKLLRNGKGMMPGQPTTVINDVELDSLVAYLRNLKVE